MAVGFAGGLAPPPADLWNQSTGAWTILTPLTPKTPYGAALRGWYFNNVSCPATNECIAVGVMSPDAGNYPLAEMWNGTAWTQMKVSAISTDDQGFRGVSCPTTTFCVAFGNKPVGTSDISPVAASWGTPPGGSPPLL
jgi:hypothetical protein